MIFKNQTNLRIRLATNVDITSSTVRQIKYKKPSGATGSWSATSEDDATGIIYYDVQSGNIDESGQWTFWAYVTFVDGRSAPGEIVVVTVSDEGTQ